MEREGVKMGRRLFVDMDGTLAVFNKVETLEELYTRGYFLHLAPHLNVINAIKHILEKEHAVRVHILSAVLTDSDYALEEKNAWLDRYLPEIRPERRLFTPCGEDKKEHIPGGITKADFLLDDYTHNLNRWEPLGCGIKLLNGINNTRGTWMGDRVRFDSPPAVLSQNILYILRRRDRSFEPYAHEYSKPGGNALER